MTRKCSLYQMGRVDELLLAGLSSCVAPAAPPKEYFCYNKTDYVNQKVRAEKRCRVIVVNQRQRNVFSIIRLISCIVRMNMSIARVIAIVEMYSSGWVAESDRL